MEVFFDTNYWGHPTDSEPMQEIRLDYMFHWEGLSGSIPAVYVSGEGIAVDFCVEIPNEAVAAFMKKWESLAQGELTEEMRESVLRENPLAFDFSAELSVGGKRLEHAFGCGAGYSRAIAGEAAAGGSLEEELVRAYGCDPDASWCFRRQIYRWEREPEQLERLDFMLTAEKKEYPCDEITIDMDSVGNVLELTHPCTGEVYRLSVVEVRQEEFPVDGFPSVGEMGEQTSWPAHYMIFSYNMAPEISESSFRLRAKESGDAPRGFISSYERSGAAAVSLIGGAEGPTSVFIAGKLGGEEPGRTAMSPLYFEPVTCASWIPVFLEKEREDLRICVEV